MRLPDNGICTPDLSARCEMVDDVVEKSFRLIDFDSTDAGVVVPDGHTLQTVCPITWHVRLAHLPKKLLRAKRTGVDSFQNAFSGMVI